MKAFIKENATLTLGLALPLLLVFLLWGASVWVERNTPPPQYDFIFANNYYEYSTGMRFTVEGGKLKASYVGKGSSTKPELYRYYAKEDVIREIPYSIPPELTAYDSSADGKNSGAVTPIAIPEMESLTLDTQGESRDGYRFESTYRGRPLMSEIFSYSNSGYALTLAKGGYRKFISVKNSYSYSHKFIGWVIPK